jgi:hypothetical protein
MLTSLATIPSLWRVSCSYLTMSPSSRRVSLSSLARSCSYSSITNATVDMA